MIPISILFFLLIIILILIICSIIVGSVQVEKISGGKNKYFVGDKYFGGNNDTLFTEIMGYLKLEYTKTGKAIDLKQIENIINTAYKTKYNISDIFSKSVIKRKEEGGIVELFMYYTNLKISQIGNKIYLSSENINSVQREINTIVDKYIDKNKEYIAEHAQALNDAIETIDKLINTPLAIPSDDDSSISSTDSNIYRDDKNMNPIAVYSDNTTRSPISRLQTPLPLSPSQYQSIYRPQSPLLPNPERSNSPSQSQYLHNSRSGRRQQLRHNAPLRGRSQNANSSFDEELNMAEINAKNTESVLGDIKDNLYSKMNQDKINQEELYKFVDNIHHTEYQ